MRVDFSALTFAAALAVGAMPGWAAAAPILDQADIPVSGVLSGTSSGFGVNQDAHLIQTFTVGLAGILTEFDLAIISTPLTPPGGFSVSLLDAADTELFTTHVDYSVAPNVFSTDWSAMPRFELGASAFAVAAGQQYQIVVRSDPNQPTGTVTWLTGVDNVGFSYAGGAGRVGYGFPPFEFGGDYGFRTYVDTAAVPEPGAWVLMILGFGVLGSAMRRRTAGLA